MYLLNEEPPLNVPRSPARLESRSRELADLFRGLPLIVATDPESPDASNPVSFEALTKSEQLLTAYFSASKVGLCILDTDFRYLAINDTMAEMNGISAAAHFGKSVRQMLGDFA